MTPPPIPLGSTMPHPPPLYLLRRLQTLFILAIASQYQEEDLSAPQSDLLAVPVVLCVSGTLLWMATLTVEEVYHNVPALRSGLHWVLWQAVALVCRLPVLRPLGWLCLRGCTRWANSKLGSSAVAQVAELRSQAELRVVQYASSGTDGFRQGLQSMVLHWSASLTVLDAEPHFGPPAPGATPSASLGNCCSWWRVHQCCTSAGTAASGAPNGSAGVGVGPTVVVNGSAAPASATPGPCCLLLASSPSWAVTRMWG